MIDLINNKLAKVNNFSFKNQFTFKHMLNFGRKKTQQKWMTD